MKRHSTIPRAAFATPALVPRQISFVTSCRAQVGRVTPCAPRSADSFPNGAHGVTRPTTSRNLFVTVLACVWPASLWACAACYGQSDSPMAQGMNWGIFSLLAVVVLVLGAIAAFFVYLAKRAASVSTTADHQLPATNHQSPIPAR